ncbi:MAG: ATP-binding protein [bacterium]
MAELAEELYKFNPWWEASLQHAFIPRPKYQKYLVENQDNADIIVITGMRRIGKTSLMKLFINGLLKNFEPDRILYVSLDALTIEQFPLHEIVREYRKLHKLKLQDRVFLFFDEVAYRKNIHQELKNLYDSENVKIFASSSSTSILRDTHAMLTGRSRVLELLPLDFDEFLAFKKIQLRKAEGYLLEKYFEEYMQNGGIPEYILNGDVSYLDNLIESIIYKDIVAFHGVRDVQGIKNFFRLLMERAGKLFTVNKVAKITGFAPDTMRRYLEFFTQVYLVYPIERCGKLNERIRAPKKVYAADVGIRNHLTGFRDKGAIFENLVFLKIKHKQPCYVYRDGVELDFMADDTLLEAKYNSDLNTKQQALFESMDARQNLIIRSVRDFLDLEMN